MKTRDRGSGEVAIIEAANPEAERIAEAGRQRVVAEYQREQQQRAEENQPDPEALAARRAWIRHGVRANDYKGRGIADIVAMAMKEYGDELVLRLDQGWDTEPAKRKAAEVWRAVLPDLTDRTTILAYIACVSWGMRMQLLTAVDAKTMIFLAQTQLSALKSIPQPAPPKPTESAQQTALWPGTDTGSGKTGARKPDPK
jgi:hypothetical protein